MKSTRQLTLFGNNAVAKTATAKKIPILSQAQMMSLCSGNTVAFRMSYFYDINRANRHYDAQLFIQALYHTGATLLNNGLAYTSNTDLKLIDSNLLVNSPAQPSQQDNALCARLIEQHNRLPNWTIRNGSHFASNPWQALFVIKIALDHLPPEEIYHWYEFFKNQSFQMTISLVPVTFANGGQFLGDHSAWQALRAYIISNMDAKFGFIPSEQKKKLLTANNSFDSSYFDLLGNSEELKPTLNELMAKNMPQLANAEQPALIEPAMSDDMKKALSDYGQCRIS